MIEGMATLAMVADSTMDIEPKSPRSLPTTCKTHHSGRPSVLCLGRRARWRPVAMVTSTITGRSRPSRWFIAMRTGRRCNFRKVPTWVGLGAYEGTGSSVSDAFYAAFRLIWIGVHGHDHGLADFQTAHLRFFDISLNPNPVRIVGQRGAAPALRILHICETPINYTF